MAYTVEWILTNVFNTRNDGSDCKTAANRTKWIWKVFGLKCFCRKYYMYLHEVFLNFQAIHLANSLKI